MRRAPYSSWVVVVCLLLTAGAQSQTSEPAGNSTDQALSSAASVPRLIQYSGVVKDRQGEPLGGVTVRLTFSVYAQQRGGVALWTESQVVELDEQGRYTVLLGATSPDGLPLALFPSGQSRWLGVQV
jgi:hypothetical protein